MKLAMIGLGKMGLNMSRRLMRGGHEVVGFDLSEKAVARMADEGAAGAASLPDAAGQLTAPRIFWLMLPAGKPVATTLEQLRSLLSEGDIIIEGGNSYYKDDRRHYASLAAAGIHYVDVGVSGGIWGLEKGYCMMAGGDRQTVDYLRPIFDTLAPPNGFLHCGGPGAGHFVKMVHNGIEYGLMQAYAEGFEIMAASDYAEEFDFARISQLWNQGSVIRSWLLELAQLAFEKNETLSDISGHVADSGEGRWTVQQAVDTAVPAEVITLALMRRFRSRKTDPFSERVLAALRREFGGHAVKKKTTKDRYGRKKGRQSAD
jgi:6-phosphogluconate dehydrogenase